MNPTSTLSTYKISSWVRNGGDVAESRGNFGLCARTRSVRYQERAAPVAGGHGPKWFILSAGLFWLYSWTRSRRSFRFFLRVCYLYEESKGRPYAGTVNWAWAKVVQYHNMILEGAPYARIFEDTENNEIMVVDCLAKMLKKYAQHAKYPQYNTETLWCAKQEMKYC